MIYTKIEIYTVELVLQKTLLKHLANKSLFLIIKTIGLYILLQL